MTFLASDLREFGRLLARADRVVTMYDVARGDTGPNVIGLRHDVDDNPGSLDTAVRLAEWEAERGYSSTYYLLHGSYYWGEAMLSIASHLEDMGHEIGIHVNAIAESLRTGKEPGLLLHEALTELRTAARVVGCVAHGDPLCRKANFVNDEMFLESARPRWGTPDRLIEYQGATVRLHPVARGDFGLEYDATWLPRGDYISDSGGEWSKPFRAVAEAFPTRGQLHILQHPDWWGRAFVPETVPA